MALNGHAGSHQICPLLKVDRTCHATVRAHIDPQQSLKPFVQQNLLDVRNFSGGELSIESHGCPILLVAHSCEIVTRINIFCSAEEEFIESLERTWSGWINYASKPDPHREPFRSRDWDQLKMVRERSHPIRNQVVLGEPDVRVTTREGLGDIAVSYSEPAGKVFQFVRKDSIRYRLSDQRFNRGDVAGAPRRLNHIGLR